MYVDSPFILLVSLSLSSCSDVPLPMGSKTMASTKFEGETNVTYTFFFRVRCDGGRGFAVVKHNVNKR